MKKTNLFRYLLCGAILLSGLSCSDDENTYDPNNVDDPEKLTEPCPTTDNLEVTHANSLYFISSWSEGTHTLSDNMVNRYQETVPYTADVLDQMQTGDAFLFSSNDIVKIQSDAELLAAMQSMVNEKGIVMMMEGGTNEDFHTVCTLLDVFNPYGETSEEEADAQSDALPLWVFSGELPGASGFFAKLVNTDNSDLGSEGSEAVETVIDEHGQGVKCDMASLSLLEALEHKPLQSGSSNLTDLVNAYIVTLQGSVTLNQKGTKTPRDGTNYYQLQAKIWNAYSVGQQRQYYLVNYGFICNAQHTFFGEWHDNRPGWLDTQFKCYGYCLTDLLLSFYPWSPEYECILHEYAPKTTQHQSTYTSEVSMELGGEISVDGPSISGGVSISNSHTETINDVEVIDECIPMSNAPRMTWNFKLKEPEGEFSMWSWASVDVVKGATVGITTFSLSTDFIFSISGQAENPQFRLFLQPTYTQFGFTDMMGDYGVQKEQQAPYLQKIVTFPKVKVTE